MTYTQAQQLIFHEAETKDVEETRGMRIGQGSRFSIAGHVIYPQTWDAIKSEFVAIQVDRFSDGTPSKIVWRLRRKGIER